jgi:hypothetical protein
MHSAIQMSDRRARLSCVSVLSSANEIAPPSVPAPPEATIKAPESFVLPQIPSVTDGSKTHTEFLLSRAPDANDCMGKSTYALFSAPGQTSQSLMWPP